MKYEYIVTEKVEKSITPEEVYLKWNKAIPTIPNCWEIADFRPPNLGETFLYDSGTIGGCHWDMSNEEPRFILRKKSEIVSPNAVTFISVEDIYDGPVTIPEGWEYVDFRLPKEDEWYLAQGDSIEKPYTLYARSRCYTPRIIVKKVK